MAARSSQPPTPGRTGRRPASGVGPVGFPPRPRLRPGAGGRHGGARLRILRPSTLWNRRSAGVKVILPAAVRDDNRSGAGAASLLLSSPPTFSRAPSTPSRNRSRETGHLPERLRLAVGRRLPRRHGRPRSPWSERLAADLLVQLGGSRLQGDVPACRAGWAVARSGHDIPRRGSAGGCPSARPGTAAHAQDQGLHAREVVRLHRQPARPRPQPRWHAEEDALRQRGAGRGGRRPRRRLRVVRRSPWPEDAREGEVAASRGTHRQQRQEPVVLRLSQNDRPRTDRGEGADALGLRDPQPAPP